MSPKDVVVGRFRALAAVAVPAVMVLCPTPSLGQEVAAVRVSGEMTLDGRLDEGVWAGARPAERFTQREPDQGSPATDATHVRFVYDDDALWIGARMESTGADAIRSLVTRRDREGSSEQLIVSLDTYRDRRTAYTFAVTPAGVRIDYFHGADSEGARDYGFDAVWEAKTTRDAGGWTAEIRIPLAQLRFTESPQQTWGVNVARSVPAKNEASYWVLVRREDTGWSSRMGALSGLDGIDSSRRVELLPYMAGSMDVDNSGNATDPFFEKRNSAARVGGDLKVGVGSSFTLAATINPDFGQVEADPAEVNLSAFETFFPERRPFFTEGAQLFAGRSLFYSRRIGAPPAAAAGAEFSEGIDNTTILGAAKLTGRTPGGLSLGALTAVTGQEEVRTFDSRSGLFGSSLVAPRTTYVVTSAQQQFGANGSTVSAILTGVDRDLVPGSRVADILSERAFGGLVDTRIRWAGGKYDMSAYLGFTHVRGSQAAILGLQRSSRRYWQRPDADHVEVDPTLTSLTGGIYGINHSKLSGEHWLWDVDFYAETPAFEPNDAGSLGSGDDRGISAGIRYRETRPGKLFRSWQVGTQQATDWTFGGERQLTSVYAFANSVLNNFWRLNVDTQLGLGGVSDALTRGGPLMAPPDWRSTGVSLRNSTGARDDWGVLVVVASDEAGASRFSLTPDFALRPGDRWELVMAPRWTKSEESRQFILSRDGGRDATYGRRYVFSHVDRSEVAAQIRLNYTFAPDFTLESYIEPFASSGTFHSFGELRMAGSGDLLEYGADGTRIVENADGSRTVTADGSSFSIPRRDFSVRSLRSNLVLRWEWRPGSTAYLVWQQDGSANRITSDVGPGDLFDAFDVTRDHFLALKVSFWIPVR